MDNNENRECECNNIQSNSMSANMNVSMTSSCNDDLRREEMLKQIKCYAFAIRDLGLYLDTHPDDEKALCLHNSYCKKYKELTDQYQKVYGPLTIYYPCNKWRWIEEPWPWEGGVN